MFYFDEDETVCLSQEHVPEAKTQLQSLSLDGLVTIPDCPGSAQGTLSKTTDNAHNEDGKLSARDRGNRSETPLSTASSEEGIILDDEVFWRTPRIDANDEDKFPAPFLKLVDALVIGSTVITTHILEDNLDWLDTNIKQLNELVDGYPDLQVHCTLIQNSLFPRLYVYTVACLTFLPSGLSQLEDLTNNYSKWTMLSEINRLAQFKTILNFILGVLEECSGSRFSDLSSKAKEIVKSDYCAIAAQILVIVSVRESRTDLLDSKQLRRVHQGIINLLQELIDVQDFESLRFVFLKTLLDLSTSSGLYPSCLLTNVQVIGSEYVDAGGFGNIWKGEHKGHAVAIKVVHRCNGESANKQFSREAMLWRQFYHPNVLPLLGVYLWAKGSDRQTSLVSPWMECGNFTQYLQKHQAAHRMPFILDIALGIEYLHTFNPAVIHGDLNDTNILISSSHRACIADFGLSTFMQNPTFQIASTSSGFAGGALLFLAPELVGPRVEDSADLQPNEPVSGQIYQKVQRCRKTLASDIYSFGCVCYEAYTGHPRFFRLLLFDAMTAARENRPLHKPAMMSETVWSLVQSCWRVKQKKRPTIKAVISSLRGNDADGKPSPSPDHFNLTSPLASPQTSEVSITTYADPPANHESTSSSLPTSDSAIQPTIRKPDYPFVIPPRVPDGDLCITEKDIIIALMGPSGAGKSSFINKLMGQSVAFVGDSVDSTTEEVQAFACLHPDGTGRKIVLIDTPGFDASDRTDHETLHIISQWLKKTYKQGIKLTGVIQLYSIANPGMRGTPLRELKRFEDLFSSNTLAYMILTTTFWSQVTPEVGLKHEVQLKSEFWADMIKRGCRVERFDPWSYETAWKIIDLFNVGSPHRPGLKVQIGMVDEKKKPSKTSAFKELAKWSDQAVGQLRGKFTKEVAHAKRQRGAQEERNLSLSRSQSSTDLVRRSDGRF